MMPPIAMLTEEQIRAILREELAAAIQALQAPEPEFYSIRETANRLRQTERTVRRMIARGTLRASKAMQGGSSRVRIPRADVEAVLAGRYGGSL